VHIVWGLRGWKGIWSAGSDSTSGGRVDDRR
jgi:hypothetical protein